MGRYRRTRRVGKCAAFTIIALLGLVGCNQSNPADITTEQRLRALAAAYLDYAVARGRGPADATELQQCLRSLAPFKVPEALRGALDDTSFLTSARSELPFVICYGQSICLTPGETGPPIAYESAGDALSCYVAFANGDVKLVSDEELKNILPSETH
jgi:hypothetical protein